jgi:hypothetical protein
MYDIFFGSLIDLVSASTMATDLSASQLAATMSTRSIQQIRRNILVEFARSIVSMKEEISRIDTKGARSSSIAEVVDWGLSISEQAYSHLDLFWQHTERYSTDPQPVYLHLTLLILHNLDGKFNRIRYSSICTIQLMIKCAVEDKTIHTMSFNDLESFWEGKSAVVSVTCPATD